MDVDRVTQITVQILTQFGLKIVGAIIFWIVGRWLINIAVRLLIRSFNHRKIDATILSYIVATLQVTLNIILIVAILGFFGIETTSFAALLAAAGVAIGAAWGGLLANFAAGTILIVLRPFKVGDLISAAGVTGTVKEIGLFTTAIDTPDNVLTIIGNNKIFSSNIQNFSANSYRRVDLVAQLHRKADDNTAIQILKEGLHSLPQVLSNPAPVVEILELNSTGPVLAVRPYCRNENYWQVYFDTNRLIYKSLGEAGFLNPE